MTPAVNIPPTKGWEAKLVIDLAFDPSTQSTIPIRREHYGPLRLQKLLYPEGADRPHLILLHPPGGVAGGDQLDIRIELQQNARALMTTPGAAKWYRCSDCDPSRQSVELRVGAGAQLEWMPQESIVFDQVYTDWQTTLRVHPEGRAMGGEVVMLGRAARGEFFREGQVSAQLKVLTDDMTSETSGKLLFAEQWQLTGDDPRLSSPQGLQSVPCWGQYWVVAPSAQLDEVQSNLSLSAAEGRPAVTRLRDQLMIIRALGDGPEMVRQQINWVWQAIRSPLFDVNPIAPRIWFT